MFRSPSSAALRTGSVIVWSENDTWTEGGLGKVDLPPHAKPQATVGQVDPGLVRMPYTRHNFPVRLLETFTARAERVRTIVKAVLATETLAQVSDSSNPNTASKLSSLYHLSIPRTTKTAEPFI